MLKGHVMPAFTFEKISPPTVRESPPKAVAKKPRRMFGDMIDRFVEARIRKNLRKGTGPSPRLPK